MLIHFHNSAGGQVDFQVSQASTPALEAFESHRIGMFISYAITSFTAHDSYAVNYLLDPPHPSTFAAPATVDSAAWATHAANFGCEYAVLTSTDQVGFNNFPFTARYNNNVAENTYDSNRGVLEVPVYKDYNVSVTSSDQNIVGKFVNQCIIEGIKSGLYYNIGKNINMRRGLDLIDASYDQTETFSLTYQNYVDFCVKELEWIAKEYMPDYIWMDAPHHTPRYVGNDRNNRMYMQDFYNAVKKHSPNTLVIANADLAVISGNRKLLPNGTDSTRPPFIWNGDELIMFPCDIASLEYFRVPSDTSDLAPVTNHQGTDYYIPKEVISTILQNNQYFARNDNFNAVESLASVQAKYDYSKANGVPFLLSVAPATNGVIPTNQLTRFGEIVL